jgi:hypothetical protein
MKALLVKVWRGLATPSPRKIAQRTVPWTIRSDACGTGWGAVIAHPEGRVWRCQGSWSQAEAVLHITHQETWAAQKALQHCLGLFAGPGSIQLQTDASCTAAVFSKGSTKQKLTAIARSTLEELNRRGVDLQMQWIPGAINIEADRLSRAWSTNTGNDYKVLPEVLFPLANKWDHKISIDMFASGANCQVKTYWTWQFDPEAAATNAMAQKWSHLPGLYANPPWPLLPKILRKLWVEGGTILMIAPVWKSASWWPLFQQMAVKMEIFPQNFFLFQNFRGEWLAQRHWQTCAALLHGQR